MTELKKSLSLENFAVARGLLTPEQGAAALQHAGGEESKIAESAVALGFVPVESAETFRHAMQKLRAELQVARHLKQMGLISEEEIEAAFKSTDTARFSTIYPPEEAPTPQIPEDLPSEVRDAMKDPEKNLERFILVQLLGKGGEGSVWKAWQKDLRRYVAVKFLELTGDDEAERFRREAVVLSELEHPNIARVYDFNYLGKPYLVMQYIDGDTIDAQRRHPDEVAQILQTVALALDAAHQRGVVHRDVKPGNIMVDRSGQVFVMDFGLAKKIDVPTHLTRTGLIMGTPAYMSPEQAQAEPVDVRTDIYSLGATGYELLAGCAPQGGTNLLEAIENVVHREPVRLRRLNPKVPADLEAIICKCMSKERERRYPHARELADDLKRYLDGEPVQAKRPSLMYTLRRKVRRHPWVALATTAAVMIGIGFGAYVVGGIVARKTQKARWVAAAENAERKGLRDEARQAYAQALSLEPWDEDLKARSDRLERSVEEELKRLEAEAEQSRRLKEATEFYRAAERDLRLLRLRSYRRDWRLTDEEFRQSEQLIAKCHEHMRRAGESADAWWVVGRAYQTLGDTTAALEAYDAGLKAGPGHSECLLHKARLLIERAILERWTTGNQRERQRRAERWTKEATELLRLGVRAGGVDPIELDLAKGYELVVNGLPAREYCQEMLNNKWSGQEFREEFYLIQGLAHPEELFKDATAARDLRPGFAEAVFWRGIAAASHDLKAAIVEFTEAIRIHPRFAWAYQNRGVAKLALDDIDGAIEDLSLEIKISPRASEGYFNRGTAYLRKGQMAKALADLDRTIELDPSHTLAFNNRGNARRAQGDLPAALRDYGRAIELDPAYAEAYNNRGVARLDNDDTRGAIDDLTMAIQLNAELYAAFASRGLAREADHDLDGAFKDETRAIELNPKYAPAFFNRASVRHSKGDPGGAIDDYTQAIALRPDYWEAYANRALARADTGELKTALEDADRSIGMSASSPEPYAARGRVEQQLAAQHSEGARTHLEAAASDLVKALELGGPTWRHRSQVESTLEQIRRKLGEGSH